MKLKSLIPDAAKTLYRRRRHNRFVRAMTQHNRLAAELYDFCEGRVLSGPFAGMEYLGQSAGSTLGPKLLGCYEIEIADWIAEILDDPPEMLIDVGAAEGYYAIGLLFACPELRVRAYDIDQTAKSLLAQLAAENNVTSRLEVLEWFSPESLADVSVQSGSRPPVIIMDVEGAEGDLITEANVGQYSGFELLIETHDFLCPGVTKRLPEVLSDTHTIEQCWSRARVASDLPELSKFTRFEALELANEHRKKQSWLRCQPKS